MEQEQKKSKKKILTYYLILAACILVIAAITVTIIFTVTGDKTGEIVADKPSISQPQPDPEKPSGGEQKPDETAAPSDSSYRFISPVGQLDVVRDYAFTPNTTLMSVWYFHEGIDFALNAGSDVVAALDGTVESITTGHELDGTKIVLRHANNIKTVYMFVDCVEGLKVGDNVARGEKIATIAAASGSENKEGPHLHFEVQQNGKSLDPNECLGINEK